MFSNKIHICVHSRVIIYDRELCKQCNYVLGKQNESHTTSDLWDSKCSRTNGIEVYFI